MNRIVIFTDSNIVLKYFSSFTNSNRWELQQLPHADLRRELKKADNLSLYLSDYASIPETQRTKDLNYLLKKQDAARGIIDRKNEIIDPADLLMKGCDYFGGNLLKAGIKPARLNRYETFFNPLQNTENNSLAANEESKKTVKTSPFIIPEEGWKGIKSGKEYTFLMLFVEISLPSEWKKKSGNVHLNQIKQTFQTVVEKQVAPYDGRLWIWNEYGGLILFPFNGTTCTPVVPAIKLLLNRVLISIEDFRLHSPISLRASMHIGTTTWKARGKTGTIISDSLNSIFHLGTKYTPVNDFDITEEVYSLLIPGLKNLFIEAGSFEGRKIFRLCHIDVIS